MGAPAPVMAPLGLTPAAVAASLEPPPSDALARYGSQLETWQRIQRLPGLELMLSPKASLAGMRAATKFVASTWDSASSGQYPWITVPWLMALPTAGRVFGAVHVLNVSWLSLYISWPVEPASK